ncbi:UV DNA damage repair endonuclease UvsE [Ectobacillus antri]|uniref:UV DNA damage endonuclease n=1 Tax=Ectobacillus antri TaxID=2486280 RepID=A0ABT6H5N8_9BACI|nr:UV DNA damage repair endonuclease UvsE [Ectobacillus antri]MDG4657658.1 UV DNA damage repair endonuclease UvsE [Ectobacillus antri]MDG5754665.1 UV DNA damage repair endonuclease UvsE [Ectobacillus antri]
MRIRFGYVSHALSLWDCSPAKTMTFTRWKQLEKQEREERLYNIIRQNIMHTMRTIHYNIAHDIPLYRMSSSIVPLATHPEVDFPYLDLFRDMWEELGALINKHCLRVSFHPNQFTLFTSDKPHVTDNAVLDMVYHYELLEVMGVEENGFLNIHVGGAYGDKTKAIKRFHHNIKKLPVHVKHHMTLENDDKTYTTKETLAVCQAQRIPLVFDYHHHLANPGEETAEELWPDVFATWNHVDLPPKVHLSSPKSEKEFRAHADYVDLEFIKPFLQVAKAYGKDFDVMIESKAKDKALLKLMDEMAKIRGFKRVGGATFEV